MASDKEMENDKKFLTKSLDDKRSYSQREKQEYFATAPEKRIGMTKKTTTASDLRLKR